LRLKSLFFLFVFVGFLITPTTLYLLEKPVDLTYVLSINEEENNKDSRVTISLDEIKFLSTTEVHSIYQSLKKKINVNDSDVILLENYFETISPPPEFF